MGVNTNITFKEIDAKHLYQAEYDQFLKNVKLKMNKKRKLNDWEESTDDPDYGSST